MSKMSVVLIEDHDLTRVGIRAGLQQCLGVEVIGEAANAINGLKLLEMTKPDVAIVDIGLPDLDGIELTQRFKASMTEPESSETKVLILTMHDQQQLVLAAFAAGADSYCIKSTSLEHLDEALRVTHEGYSWIDPAIARIVLEQSRTVLCQASAMRESKTVKISPVDSDYSQLIEAYPLTERELEVLELIVQGYNNGAIAQQLYITVGTVKTHVRNILNKLCVDDRTQAAVRALRAGLVS
jgi:DNA-binding NarL/FixJ family response regulator